MLYRYIGKLEWNFAIITYQTTLFLTEWREKFTFFFEISHKLTVVEKWWKGNIFCSGNLLQRRNSLLKF